MAVVLVLHLPCDQPFVESVQGRLRGWGHQVALQAGNASVGITREKSIQALSKADVVVVLLRAGEVPSPDILQAIGAARAFSLIRRLLLLAVIVDGDVPPESVRDFECIGARSVDPSGLSDMLNIAIAGNLNQRPKIFISHRHEDFRVVSALTHFLEQAFSVNKEDIRCTSVPPYTLGLGVLTSETLRTEIAGSEVVIGVLSPDTSQSKYVLFELGAAWGQGLPTFPLLIRGAVQTDVPSPLNERHCISLEVEDHCIQLLRELENRTSLRQRSFNPQERLAAARVLSQKAKP